MAQRMIFYTSESEGLTLGVAGENWMDCLLALSEEFGEGLLPLYEKTKEELEALAGAVAETYPDEMHAAASQMAQAVIRAKSEEQQYEQTIKNAEERDAKDRVRQAIADSEAADDGDSGARQESLPEADAVRPTRSDGDPVCEVCGATTTKDYATVTRLDYGEVRCPDCTP